MASASALRSTVLSIPSGDAGVHVTVRQMEAFATGMEGAKNPYLHQLALSIVHDVSQRDQTAEMRALEQWVRTHVPFRGEYRETLKTPLVTAGWDGQRFDEAKAGGDCDCQATLLAALLNAVGIQTRFVTIASDSRDPKTLNHVYLAAKDKRTGQWFALDPTRRPASSPNIFRQVLYRPFGPEESPSPASSGSDSSLGDSGGSEGLGFSFGGMFGGIGKAFESVGRGLNTKVGEDIIKEIGAPIASGIATKIAFGGNSSYRGMGVSASPNPFPQPGEAPMQSIFQGIPFWVWLGLAAVIFVPMALPGRRR